MMYLYKFVWLFSCVFVRSQLLFFLFPKNLYPMSFEVHSSLNNYQKLLKFLLLTANILGIRESKAEHLRFIIN
jgi:hypothetical protein